MTLGHPLRVFSRTAVLLNSSFCSEKTNFRDIFLRHSGLLYRLFWVRSQTWDLSLHGMTGVVCINWNYSSFSDDVRLTAWLVEPLECWFELDSLVGSVPAYRFDSSLEFECDSVFRPWLIAFFVVLTSTPFPIDFFFLCAQCVWNYVRLVSVT
jgi:hypothetical protein